MFLKELYILLIKGKSGLKEKVLSYLLMTTNYI